MKRPQTANKPGRKADNHKAARKDDPAHAGPAGGRAGLIWPFLSLFSSIGTLVCCALPALVVSLGMGAALAGFIAHHPWITVISEHKNSVFAVAGLLLALSGVMLWRGRKAPCPADPAKARACKRLRAFSIGIFALSLPVYATGLFFAYFAAALV